jgi:thiamine-phosphate pyrophosphorylase
MRLERPLVCLVTDRRRLIDGDAPFDITRAMLLRIAREAAAAGVDLIQVREPGLEAAQLTDLVAAIVAVTRGSPTLVVVNDRLDVALTSGAHGVHLRADSIPPRLARAIAPPGFVVGRSVHHLEEAREQASAVDYLIAGTVFPTSSKPSAGPLLGQRGLREIATAVDAPVIAIGGLTLDRMHEAAAAGAAGIAGIRLFLPGGMPLARVVDAARAEFDSVKAASRHTADRV